MPLGLIPILFFFWGILQTKMSGLCPFSYRSLFYYEDFRAMPYVVIHAYRINPHFVFWGILQTKMSGLFPFPYRSLFYYALSGLFIWWYRSFLHRATPYVHGSSPFRAKSVADPADSNLLGYIQDPKSPGGAEYTNDGHRPSYGKQPDDKP